MSDSPMEAAREYIELAYPAYSLRETLEHETDYESVGDIDAWHHITVVVADDDGTEKRIQLTVEDHAEEYVVSNADVVTATPEEGETGDNTESDPSSPIEAATQYLEQAYPAYTLRETLNHDKDYETVGDVDAWHYFTFLVTDDGGSRKEVQITVNELVDGSYEVGDSEIEDA